MPITQFMILKLPSWVLGLLFAGGLVLLSVSGYVMWWRRRTTGLLGAPAVLQPPRFRWPLLVSVLLLAVYLPLFGLSLLVVLLVERWVLRKIPVTRDWLGLSAPSPELSSIPT